MNAVEIEEAVSALAVAPFERSEFPYLFLAAFGNKETTIQRLRSGSSNTSDVAGAILQRTNIHIATCDAGKVGDTLTALKASPKTAKGKVKFVLATDGHDFEAEELATGETVACAYSDFANHFGFFLPLAGISTVAEIKNNPIDIKATSRLNKLYVELLKENEDWASEASRQELNQFLVRLIFCFFAEDTGIFNSEGLFTACIKQMTDPQSFNTHEVIKELFRAMDTKPEDRKGKGTKNWANAFPYVNGGLFTNKVDSPRFSKIARSYLIRAGELNWKEINPDIFGSMIQAVADNDERGELGMHYTSVPNILKVLDPLFLNDLRQQLEEAEDNPRKLLNLRKRIAAIRVFDPACGSGNFLVIAYIKMREIEAEIIRRRKDEDKKTWIKLTNFFGIEIKSLAAEVARLSLLIAEFQCNVRLIGQREACLDVLPLHDTGHIHHGNALQMDWLKVCPPPAKESASKEDLGGPTGRLALDAMQSEWETYICGNPPYVWSNDQTPSQKADLGEIFQSRSKSWKSANYIAGWFIKASEYGSYVSTCSAFVSTNTICQGQQVEILWPVVSSLGHEIFFAHTSFKWSNLAKHNAGVTVVVVGLRTKSSKPKMIYSLDDNGNTSVREVANINAYLVPSRDVIISKRSKPCSDIATMSFGNKPVDGGHLLLSLDEVERLELSDKEKKSFLRRVYGSAELIDGLTRYCIWIEDSKLKEALGIKAVAARIAAVRDARLRSPDKGANALAERPHQFREMRVGQTHTIVMPAVSSETRQYLPAGLLGDGAIITNRNYGIYDAPLWNLALLASRLHWVWISTVCGRLELRFSYTSTLGWNTFPVPPLTENQKADLTRCAEDILLARETHFPATIADLYDPENMPGNLRAAHDKNDETLERIYIGRRFKNDTERLEKLFDMYTKMTKDEKSKQGKVAS